MAPNITRVRFNPSDPFRMAPPAVAPVAQVEQQNEKAANKAIQATNDSTTRQFDQLEQAEPGRFEVVKQRDLSQWQTDWQARQPGWLEDAVRVVGGGIAKGSGQVLAGLGRAVKADPVFGRAINDTGVLRVPAEWLTQFGEDAQKGMSVAAKQAIADSTPGGDLLNPSSWTLGEAPSIGGYAALSADVFGSMLPVIAASIAGGPIGAAVVGGAQGGGAAAQQAEGLIDQMASEPGVLEQESAFYREQIAAGKSAGEALAATREAAAQTAFIMTAPISALGGYATGRILDPAQAVLAGKSLLARITGRAALSAVEEGSQEAAESVATNVGTNVGAGTNVDATQGTFADFLLGAMAGGAPGAVAGGLSAEVNAEPALAAANQPDVQSPPVAQPAGPVPTSAIPAQVAPQPKPGPLTAAVNHGLSNAPMTQFIVNDPPLPGQKAGPEHGQTVTLSADQSGIDPSMRKVAAPDGSERVLGTRLLMPVDGSAPAPDPQATFAPIDVSPSMAGLPNAGQRVIVEAPGMPTFTAQIEQFITTDGVTEAVVVDDNGEVLQLPVEFLKTQPLSRQMIEDAERQENPPLERDPVPASPTTRQVGQAALVFPDETLAKLFDLGKERQQIKRLERATGGGGNAAAMQTYSPEAVNGLADELGVLPTRINEIADDYRYRAERAAKNGKSGLPQNMHGLNADALKRWRAERANGAPIEDTGADAESGLISSEAVSDVTAPETLGGTPISSTDAGPVDDAAWWDGLAPGTRTTLLASVGVKRSAKSTWDKFSKPIRAKLLPLRVEMQGLDRARANSRALDQATEAAVTLDVAANDAATSPVNDLPEPTQAQKEAGNYKLGHHRVGGLDLSIENPAGSERKGVDKGGKAWSVTMKSHYGYIKGTVGKDKDHVDVFVAKGTEDLADDAPVFVVDQVNRDGGLDEHKVMLGYRSQEQARKAYLANYSKGWKGLGNISSTSLAEFKQWLKEGDTSKPFAKSDKAPPVVKTAAPAETVATPTAQPQEAIVATEVDGIADVQALADRFADPLTVAERWTADPSGTEADLDRLRTEARKVERAIFKKHGVNTASAADDADLTDAERHFLFTGDGPTDRESIGPLSSMIEPVLDAAEATAELRRALKALPAKPDYERMPRDGKIAVGRMLVLGSELNRLGVDASQAIRAAAQSIADQYRDADDAEFMVRSVLERLKPFVGDVQTAAPTRAERALKALAAAETTVDAPVPSFADYRAALPFDDQGDADLEGAGRRILDNVAGAGTAWATLSASQKRKAVDFAAKLAAKASRKDSIDTRARLGRTVGAVRTELRRAGFGSLIDQLEQAGRLSIVEASDVDAPEGVQGWTDPDGSITLIADNIADGDGAAVLLHEAFHSGARPLLGSEKWRSLMIRLAGLYRQFETSNGRAREFFDAARARVQSAEDTAGTLTEPLRVEEFAAYAIEEHASAPPALSKWVDDVLGAVKAWALQRFGQQIGSVTPGQLRAIATAALRDVGDEALGQGAASRRGSRSPTRDLDTPAGWGEVETLAETLTDKQQAELAALVQQVSGLTAVQWQHRIRVKGGNEDWGTTKDIEAAGFYDPVTDIIGLTTQWGNPRTAYHEAFHRLQWRFLSDQERKLLAAEEPALRKMLAGHRPAQQIEKMALSEVEAEAFGLWASGAIVAPNNKGLRGAWRRMKLALSRAANYLMGLGWQMPEDIFAAALAGQIVARGPLARRRAAHTRGNGERAFSVAEPSKAKMRLGPATNGMSGIVAAIKGKLKDMDPSMLALVPLNYFKELRPDFMPAVDLYLKVKRRMDAYRGDKHAQMDSVAQEWRAYAALGLMPFGAGKAAGKARSAFLSDLMHDATLAGIDPSVTDDEMKAKPGYAELRARYNQLPPKGKALLARVRDAYRADAEELDSILLENVRLTQSIAWRRSEDKYRKELQRIEKSGLKGLDKSKAENDAQSIYTAEMNKATWNSKARMTKLRLAFEASRVPGFYVPLSRFGRYFVSVKDVNGEVLHFAKLETEAARAAEEARLRKDFPVADIVTGVMEDKSASRDAMDPRIIAEIESILGQEGVDDSVMDQIWQRYLQTMPELSMRKRFIHRKGTAGYGGDALRSFASHMFHSAHQMGRLKFGLELEDALNQVVEQAKDGAANNRDAMTLANELKKRDEWIRNPEGNSAVQTINSAMFVWHLAATPAAAALNLTQTPMLGIPVLGARLGGMGKASAALLKASGDVLRGKGSALRASLSADERRAMEAFYESGLIDRTQSHDLAGIGEQGIGYSPVRERVMGVMSWAFHNAEVLNREVTALAAYRMARAQGQHEMAAIDTAHDLSWKIHFDPSNSSRARILQKPAAKAIFVFQSHSLNLWYRIARDMHQSFKGATPQARKEARYQLFGVMAMQALMGGIKGFFGYNVIVGILGLTGWLNDDDDPRDLEARMSTWLIDTLGPDLAGIVLKGAPGHLTGVDLSSRVGMMDFMIRMPDSADTAKDYGEQLIVALGGATASTLVNTIDGFDQLTKGNTLVGVGLIAPKFVRDTISAYRFMTEGLRTRKGDVIIEREDLDWWDVTSKALGFQPAKVAEAYERNAVLYDAADRVQVERSALMRRYTDAIVNDDDTAKLAALEAIKTWNAKGYAKPNPITTSSLRSSLRSRLRNAAKREDGVLISNDAVGAYLRMLMPDRVY